ncbi:MAG: hypothetical protein SGPRY_004897 [Prymnesium sp.]
MEKIDVILGGERGGGELSLVNSPPKGGTVSGLALAPEGHGLLVCRWREGEAPQILLVSDEGEGGETANELVAELAAILAEDATEGMGDVGSEEEGGGEVGKSFNDRVAFWRRREALDLRLARLTERMESGLLRDAIQLLTLPPSLPSSLLALVEGRAARAKWRVREGALHPICEALAAGRPLLPLRVSLADALSTSSGAALGEGVVNSLAKELNRRVEEGGGRGGEGVALMLLIDESLGSLPWESMPSLRHLPVCRLPSAARTQRSLEEQIARPPRVGVVGRPPECRVLQEPQFKPNAEALQAKEVYIYCGHGDGRRYLPAHELQKLSRCPATLLMGCSSGRIKLHGGMAPSGMALHYLHARCPALVANCEVAAFESYTHPTDRSVWGPGKIGMI